MAGKFRVGFSIEGDSSKAMQALGSLAATTQNYISTLNGITPASAKINAASAALTSNLSAGWNKAKAALIAYNQTVTTSAVNTSAFAAPAANTAQSVPGALRAAATSPAAQTFLTQATAGINNVATMVRSASGVIIPFLGRMAAGFLASAAAASGLAKSAVSGMFNGLGNTIKNSVGWVDKFRQNLMNLNDMFRLSAQAITNIGRSLLFFVSVPLAAFFSKATGEAIKFEDAMIRVQRATGLTGNLRQTADGIGWLGDRIRLLARNTATAHVELAKIAGAIGQAGAQSAQSIFNLTRAIDMFAVGTNEDLTASADAVIRFSNAFGWSLDNNTGEIWKFLNVVNLVGKRTAATAGEVLRAATDFAPYGAMLKMTAAEVAALSAALPSLGLSADEAGTAMKNMAIKAVENADKIAKFMGPINAAYKDTNAVMDMLNKNATQVFLDIVEAANKATDKAGAIKIVMDIFEQRGGKAIAVLANNFELLQKAMSDAKTEWDTGKSLINDYNLAMSTTQSQLGMMKNNVTDVAITVGSVLLPVINEIISVMVPAVRMLSDEFKKLDRSKQIMIILGAVIAVVAGPVLMFFGQMMHAVTLFVWAFGQGLRIFPFVAATLLNIGSVIGTVASAILSWPGIFIGVAIIVLKILDDLGVNIAGFFRGIADTAEQWGANLAQTFGSGILAGAKYIMQAISYIANLIASFFEAHSPPEKGPLSGINKWGSKLLQTYLNGFMNADFSVLSEIGSTIERMLTRGVTDKNMPNALKKVAKARVYLSQLISKFNSTGIIDTGLLNKATAGLGHMADEVRELIKLNLIYNALLERIKQLEEDRKTVIKGYNDELAAIAGSNMSLEEKVAAIRAAQRARDDDLRAIEKEKQGLEEQAAQQKENLDYQNKMLDAMNDQDDLLDRIRQAVEALKKAMDGAAAGGGFSFDDTSLDEVTKQIQDAQSAMGDLIDRFTDGKNKLQGFLDAWMGADPKKFMKQVQTPEGSIMMPDTEVQAGYDALYKLGQQAADVRDRILGAAASVSAFIEPIKKGVSDLIASFKGDKSQQNPIAQFATDAKTKWDEFVAWIKPAVSYMGLLWGSFSTAITPGLQSAGRAFSALGNILKAMWDRVQPIFVPFQKAVLDIGAKLLTYLPGAVVFFVGILGAAIGGIISFVSWLVAGVVTVLGGVAEFLVGIGGAVINGIVALMAAVVAIFTGDWETVKTFLAAAWAGIVAGIEGFAAAFMGVLLTLPAAVGAWAMSLITGIINFFQYLYDQLVGHSIIPDMVAAIISAIATGFATIITNAGTFVSDLITTLGARVKDFVTKGKEYVDGLKKGIVDTWNSLVTAVTKKIDELGAALKGSIATFQQIGSDIGKGFISGIKSILLSIAAKAPEPFNSWLKKIVSGLQIGSPSRVAEGIGTAVGQGFINGMTDQIDAAVTSNMLLGSLPTPGYSVPAAPSQNIKIEINNPVIQDERDINTLVARIKEELARSTNQQLQFGGYPNI